MRLQAAHGGAQLAHLDLVELLPEGSDEVRASNTLPCVRVAISRSSSASDSPKSTVNVGTAFASSGRPSYVRRNCAASIPAVFSPSVISTTDVNVSGLARTCSRAVWYARSRAE